MVRISHPSSIKIAPGPILTDDGWRTTDDRLGVNGLSYFLSERFWLKRTTDDWSGRRMVWRTGVNGALYNRPQFTCTPTRVGDFVSGSVNHKFQEISGNYLNLTYLTWLFHPSPSSRRTPASTRYWSNAGLMLGQRRRRWAQHQSQHCLKRSLIRGEGPQQRRDIDNVLVQCWPILLWR